MSGLCGWVGDGDRAVLDAMLAAIDYRGDDDAFSTDAGDWDGGADAFG